MRALDTISFMLAFLLSFPLSKSRGQEEEGTGYYSCATLVKKVLFATLSEGLGGLGQFWALRSLAGSGILTENSPGAGIHRLDSRRPCVVGQMHRCTR